MLHCLAHYRIVTPPRRWNRMEPLFRHVISSRRLQNSVPFDAGAQDECRGALSHLLGAIDKEWNNCTNGTSGLSPSLLHFGRIVNRITHRVHEDGGHTSALAHVSTSVQVDIMSGASTSHLFQQSFNSRWEDDVRCDHCLELGCDVEECVESFPLNVLLSICRTNANGGVITDGVAMSRSVAVRVSGREVTYNLRGFVCRTGATINNGHYIAY
jgi:hypothetical protein